MFGRSRKNLMQSKRPAHNFQFRAPILLNQDIRSSSDFSSSANRVMRKWAAPAISLIALFSLYQALQYFPTFQTVKQQSQFQILGLNEKILPEPFELKEDQFINSNGSIDLKVLRKILLAESIVITESASRDLSIQVTHPEPAMISDCGVHSFLSSKGSYFETTAESFLKLVSERLPTISSDARQKFCEDINNGLLRSELASVAGAINSFSQLGYPVQRIALDSGRGITFESDAPSIRFVMSLENIERELQTLRWLKSRAKITPDVSHVELDVAGKAFLRRKPRS